VSYAVVQMRHSKDPEGGWEPAFPHDVGFLLLADCPLSGWALYSYDTLDSEKEWAPLLDVPPSLRVLLDSAQRWPPAMAVSRQKVEDFFRGSAPEPADFLERLELIIRREFAAAFSGFQLRENRIHEVCYRAPGDWFWVRPKEDKPGLVEWVSDDFFLYVARSSDFRAVGNEAS